jgi:hypothetical protein
VLVDDFLPVYDVSDSVVTVVRAHATTTWDALMQVDLIDAGRRRPMVGVLGALRALPEVVGHLLHGEQPHALPSRCAYATPPKSHRAEGDWVFLGERLGDEIALGLVEKFWRRVIAY